MKKVRRPRTTHVRSDLIAELLRVFQVFQRPFTRKEFDNTSPLGSKAIDKAFGSWANALEKSGLAAKFAKFKEVEAEVKQFNPDKEAREAWTKKKQELIENSERRRLASLRDYAQKVDIIREMLEETIAKAEPPVVDVQPLIPHPVKPEKPHITLWCEFSDLQLGTLMTPTEMGGLNKHNWMIWKAKLAVWTKAIIEKISKYSVTHNIDNVVLACLGDMVEGQDIFKGQVWQIDRHVVDQAIDGANDTAAAFIEIMLSHPEQKFRILEVFGNHGRTQKKGEAPYACSMDKVYQRFLESQIARAGVPNYTYYRNEAWFYLLEIYGFNHLLLHGDQGTSGLWSGRPTLNGLEKALARWGVMLQQVIHYLHIGHFHQAISIALGASQLLINGSFIGTSKFSATQMVASSPPIQAVHVFCPRAGLIATEYILLTEDHALSPCAQNVLE